MVLFAADLSVSNIVLVALGSGALGTFVGGAITLKVSREAGRRDERRQWRSIGADAYALTLACASEYSLTRADIAARHRHDTAEVPASYALVRERAATALGHIERTSVLSDDERVRKAAEALSRLLRDLDHSWGDIVGWRGKLLDNEPESAPFKSAAAQVDRLNFKVDELLAAMYGAKGGGGAALDDFREAVRDASERARSRPARWFANLTK